MTAYVLEDYLREVKQQIAHLPFRERDAIAREMKAHLQSEVKRLRSEEPGLSADEAALRATAAFGEPEELGIAYGPHGGIVRKSSGDLLLRVAVLTGRGAVATAKAAGRGARSFLKWTGIVALILLVSGLILGVTALIAYSGTVEKLADKATSFVQRDLILRSDSYPEPTTSMFQDSFSIRPNTIKSQIFIQQQGDLGCLWYTITGPDGETLADTTGTCDNGQTLYSFTKAGDYRIQYRLIAYRGTLQVDGSATDQITM
ncbi:MAG: hypothetical protein AABX89_08760 [Candidatus Thermoplasmatota archaeon]